MVIVNFKYISLRATTDFGERASKIVGNTGNGLYPPHSSNPATEAVSRQAAWRDRDRDTRFPHRGLHTLVCQWTSSTPRLGGDSGADESLTNPIHWVASVQPCQSSRLFLRSRFTHVAHVVSEVAARRHDVGQDRPGARWSHRERGGQWTHGHVQGWVGGGGEGVTRLSKKTTLDRRAKNKHA